MCHSRMDTRNEANGLCDVRQHWNFAPTMLTEHDCLEKLSNLQSNGTVAQDERPASNAFPAKIRTVLHMSRRRDLFVCFIKMPPFRGNAVHALEVANNVNDDCLDPAV